MESDDARAGSGAPLLAFASGGVPFPTRASLRNAARVSASSPVVAPRPVVAPAFGEAAPSPGRVPAALASAASPAPLPATRTASTAGAVGSIAPQPVAAAPGVSEGPVPASTGSAPIGSAPAAPAPAAPAAVPAGYLDPRLPLLPGGPSVDEVGDEELARSTIAERILFVLAFVLGPVGLVGSIVAAVRSERRRGWVIALVQAGVAVGVVFSILAGVGGYVGYEVLRQRQEHDRTAAASAAFCAAFAKDPTLSASDGGWPQPAVSVAESITGMQAFVARWNAVGAVSPTGIRPGVVSIAAAGTEVIGSVNVQRTIDDTQNRQVIRSAVSASGVAGWRADYCG